MHASLVIWLRRNKLTSILRQHAQPLYRPLKNAAKATLMQPAVLSPALRDELTQGFREDLLRLQDMIGRDLSPWLAPMPQHG